MNVPVEITQLQHLLWNQMQDAGAGERVLEMIRFLGGEMLSAAALPLVCAGLLVLASLLFYHPRVPRGALWVPALGILGGTPKFYTHSRPASLFGMLLKHRHRVAVTRKRRG